MAPAAVRVRLKVMTAVPRPLASALVTVLGATSFAGSSVAVNVIVFGTDGVDGLSSPPHPAASAQVRRSTPDSLIGYASGSKVRTFERC
jgi:hypothetical protein